MSVSYTWVGWNRHKRRYDAAMIACVLAFLGVFIAVTSALPSTRTISPAILLIRAMGACAIVMLHLTLAIGPLHRLSPIFAPLLYNRRHLGVCTFVLGAMHAGLSLVWYHGFGTLPPPVSVLASNPHVSSFTLFPFELLGLGALAVLFLMAATSHDFWLRNLSPQTWKSLHMLVYVAYAALVLHVALGVIQLEKSLLYPSLIAAGAITLTALHVVAALREARADAPAVEEVGAWIDAGEESTIPESRARVVCSPRAHAGRPERIAVFRHQGRLCAVGNVCAHQGGPLGEGRVIDGCITCPWHGYQYQPQTGASPPPFTERVPTYQVRVVDGRVKVKSEPSPA